MSLVQVLDSLSLNPELVGAIRSADGGKKCSVFLAGQSAVDGGFLVDKTKEEVENALREPQDRIKNAAQALLDALDAAHPHMQELSTFGNDNGSPYAGPSFFDETEELRAALEGYYLEYEDDEDK